MAIDPTTRLNELWAEIRDLQSAQDVLDWDQETQMPEGGVEARAKLCATVAGLRHRLLSAAELADTLAACAAAAEPAGPSSGPNQHSPAAAQVRQAQLEVDRATRMPEALAKAIAEAKSRGSAAWQKARAASDFRLFEKELAELLALRLEQAAAIAPASPPYDAMLDLYEKGATEAQLVPLFDQLVAVLRPLVRAVRESGVVVDERPVQGFFPAAQQRELAVHAAEAFGFAFERGRLDLSAHPFCLGLAPTDVRLTWRYQEDDFRPALYGVLHECGHGLYEQGLPMALWRTPAGDACSTGIHESQSRFWENQVGRSRGFWRWLWPKFRQLFPSHPETDPARIWPALHTIQPSLIRVEADEGTYNLHIAIRFEIERALLAGRLKVGELPGAWDDLYQSHLGLRAKTAADGVLQDIHWSQGLFGYFPTYTLGTMLSAQLAAAAAAELGNLEDRYAAGDFSSLLAWLRDKVHRHAALLTADELVQQATGRPLGAGDLVRYLQGLAAEVYGISPDRSV